eukprot:TRINITY_DN11977_c0_g1_i3.p1 TRINITY_DN11977_c0_g1~~TRINITY_DN11977_c0_g1_i3.p1  ORF type:complete len:114 (+),score=43.85 TRINITY_DN11977_c0_g1_i3:217-558(+)
MNVLVQQALPSNSPGGSIVFSFLRDAIASPVLTAAMLVTKSYVRPKAKDLVKLLVVMGALGMSGNQTFFVLGLDIVGSDIAAVYNLSLIHISEPTRLLSISYAVFCLKKKKKS